MKSDPFNWIDALVAPVPLVGQLWADALYTAIGLADALNIQHFNGENVPIPPTQNIVELQSAKTPSPAPLREAA
jgi:hypothetical protein